MFESERKRDQLVKKLVEIKRQNVELKAALEEALKQSDERYRALAEGINDAIFSSTPPGILPASARRSNASPAISRRRSSESTMLASCIRMTFLTWRV